MQRLFSTFADGWPGGGILLLRMLAGFGLIHCGIAAFAAPPHLALLVLRIIGAAAGVLILGGLATPLVGLLAGIVETCLAFTEPGTQLLAIMLAVLSISLAMIGPGAWSIDARLYGRKQLLKPEP